MRITLIRHGIAEDAEMGQSDFDRALTDEGCQKLLKRFLKHRQSLSTIDKIICSPSLRTRQTCSLLCSITDIAIENINYDKNLYMFENNYHILLDSITHYQGDSAHICLVGHDYGISDLAMYFDPSTERMKKGEIRIFSIDGL